MSSQALASGTVHIKNKEVCPFPARPQTSRPSPDTLDWCTLFWVLPGMPRHSEDVAVKTALWGLLLVFTRLQCGGSGGRTQSLASAGPNPELAL